MKATIKSLTFGILAAAALSGCNDYSALDNTGEGLLKVSASISTDVEVKSRASLADELSQSTMLWISNSKGLVRRYDGLDNVPAGGIALYSGHYVAEAWAGDSVPASFDARWFKGYEPFDIKAGQTTEVNIVCKIANTVVSVSYDENIDEMLSDYTMTVGHKGGSLTFEGRDTRKGYFMMSSKSKDLTWTLEGKLSTGDAYTLSGEITAAKPATEYKLRVKYNQQAVEVGGAWFEIEVDETEVEVTDNVVITAAPEITGYNFDITRPVSAEAGAVGRRSVIVKGLGELKSVILDNDRFAELLSISGNDFDVMTMTPEVTKAVNAAGINWVYTFDADNDNSLLKINFEEVFTNSLANGEYVINIAATDTKGKVSRAALTFSLGADPLRVDDAAVSNCWTKSATLSATVLAGGENYGFRYRKAGESDWQTAPVELSGDKLVANLSALDPATEYQYTFFCDGFDEAEVKSFTTGAVLTIPNAGFETYQQIASTKASGKTVWDFNDGALYWDCGNHGSTTMQGKQVTEPDTDVKHSGNASVRLKSDFVGIGMLGKFAAGNIFIGEYLKTDGTDGILGWGRPFAARPTALRGYAKYKPAAIQSAEAKTANNEGLDVKEGDMDKGIIYIALLDNSQTEWENGISYPVVVKTKKAQRSLFKNTDPNVIAYGRVVFDKEDADFQAFNVELEYYRTDVIPSNIMITCSASINGDYFVGGRGATLWIDDLELVYDK